ncbi:class I SAM-dependent methyltransferase [Flavobacterium sp.]|uniref:class I SAM-dependent methyltransferase n=1 Tax=Flavobacterium sp. TaxID=239 RepID=UPI002613FC24|nr:class I SAM-dependent methyltransferase [Flavobacterium sp.]
METPPCPLCRATTILFNKQKERIFLQCSNCCSVLLHPQFYLSAKDEAAHYRQHNNNPSDTNYQKFISPVTKRVLDDFTVDNTGLDFGSGTGSAVVKVLEDNHYCIKQYDSFFHTDVTVLKQKYDYITCTEVAEHFKDPYKEFELLRKLLRPKGKLYIMTELFDTEKDFALWYYKNDPTHVFFYHKKAFEWIKYTFGYNDLYIEKRLVVLSL